MRSCHQPTPHSKIAESVEGNFDPEKIRAFLPKLKLTVSVDPAEVKGEVDGKIEGKSESKEESKHLHACTRMYERLYVCDDAVYFYFRTLNQVNIIYIYI